MSKLQHYQTAFRCARLRREDGILEIRLGHDGGEFVWGRDPHAELPVLFREVGDDPENRIIILTGTGAVFTGPEASSETRSITKSIQPDEWHFVIREARQMLMNLLNIDVPMIAAINGPAYRHMELPLLCDIVLASEDAIFEDAAHIKHGNLAPGDGMNILLALLMGINRARYLHLTGQRLNAEQALQFGLVNEVLVKADVVPRAWTLARELRAKPDLMLRQSRMLMTQYLKQQFTDHLVEHMLYEGIAQLDQVDPMRTDS